MRCGLDPQECLPSFMERLDQQLDDLGLLFSRQEAYCYSVKKGRRFRPLLVFVACKAVNGCALAAVPGALAVELLHKAAVMHDDLVDGDHYRPGREAMHIRFGTEQALAMGDALVGLSFDILERLGGDYSLTTVLTCYQVLAKTLRSMSLGQIEDLLFEKRQDVSLAESKEMTQHKSALIGAALCMGAILGGGTAEQVEALDKYGRSLGFAFQLTNDLDNVLGLEMHRQENIGSDLARRKKTVLVAHALTHLPDTHRSCLLEIMQSDHCSGALAEAKNLISRAGSFGYVMDQIRCHLHEASCALTTLPDSTAKAVLYALAEGANERLFWQTAAERLYRSALSLRCGH